MISLAKKCKISEIVTLIISIIALRISVVSLVNT